MILALPDLLRAAQRAFDETGGLHAAGPVHARPASCSRCARTSGGTTRSTSSSGSQVLAKAMPLHDRILMVSGRVSFEIVQKAAVAGVPIVCAVSAPSDLAIEAADRLGVTLVGFLRGDGFNVYAHDERIDLRDLHRLRLRLSGAVGCGPRFWTNSKPNRPLMQRWPSVTDESSGEVDLDDRVVLDVERRASSRRRSTGRSSRSPSGRSRPRSRPRACRARS